MCDSKVSNGEECGAGRLTHNIMDTIVQHRGSGEVDKRWARMAFGKLTSAATVTTKSKKDYASPVFNTVIGQTTRCMTRIMHLVDIIANSEFRHGVFRHRH